MINGKMEQKLIYCYENIIALYSDSSEEIITKRKNNVNTLCVHNGILYDGGVDYKIYETLKNKEVAQRSNVILKISSLNGELFDCGYYGLYKNLDKPLIKNTDQRISTICVNNGIHYHAGLNGEIYQTYEGIKKATRKNAIYGLYSINGKLYDSTKEGINETLTNKPITLVDKISDTVYIDNKNINEIIKKDEQYYSLCYQNGRIFELRKDGVYEIKIMDKTIFNKKFYYKLDLFDINFKDKISDVDKTLKRKGHNNGITDACLIENI